MPGPSRLLAVDSEECNSFLEEQFTNAQITRVCFFGWHVFVSGVRAGDRCRAEGGILRGLYSRYDGGLNATGWDTTVTGNVNRWFGIAADFSGGYGSQSGVSIHNYTYTFGPVVSLRQSRTFTPFAHFLAGGNRASASFSGISGSSNGFA